MVGVLMVMREHDILNKCNNQKQCTQLLVYYYCMLDCYFYSYNLMLLWKQHEN